MSYRGSDDFAKETGPTLRLLKGMIRRMVITLTDGVKWQLLGQRGGSGGDETPQAEPFTGIGFYSRPPSSGSPEAIATAVGGAKTLAIVATRDEATRKAVAGDTEEDETVIFNSVALVYVKKTGIVEIRKAIPTGTVEPTIKGATYRAAEDTLITALTAALAAINAYAVAIKPIADPSNAATPALTAAMTGTWTAAVAVFQLAAANYLSTVAKVE